MKGFRAPVAAVMAAALVALGGGVASAQETPGLEGLVNDVQEQVQPRESTEIQQETDSITDEGITDEGELSTEGTAPATDGEADTQADPEAAAEQAEETGSTARAQVAEVDLGDNDVLDLARSEVAIDDDGRTTSDATLLALGGEEIIGAHADSHGENESHAGDPLAPLCEGSEGQLCLRLLYADAYADEDTDSSEGLAQSGVLNACVGGDSADARAECSGPVSAKLLTSKAWMQRDKTDGSTEGRSESSAADICVGPEDDSCAVGLEVLKAWSAASSDGTADGWSTLARLQLGNEEVLSVEDPAELAVQPECAEPSVLCAAANEGATTVQDGAATATQDALNVGVLPDSLGADAGISRTGVSADTGAGAATGAGEVAGVQQEAPGGEVAGAGAGSGAGGPGHPAAAAAGAVLPNTGGVWSGLLAIALGAMAAGSFLVAWSRRRVGATA
jgi:LPXTG-motif cell wall-anchored protein